MRAVILAALMVPAVAGAETPALKGRHYDRALFPNPYGHIPAQCYTETAAGAQNPCQYCHTDGLANRRFGNNAPQRGASAFIGDLTADYAFAAYNQPFTVNGSVNPWRNTLHPEALAAEVAALGVDPAAWDIDARLAEDNWQAAYARRPSQDAGWDTGAVGDGLRLFPALNPADLPAGDDGFVRSADGSGALFQDDSGGMTGWRAVNFTLYGIFTPLTGSVSGIYVRLPTRFMRDDHGRWSREIYARNLDLLSDAIQDRLGPDAPRHYAGGAAGDAVEPGLYPVGTEFAHPLHYVDVTADGTASRYPGARALRVKEVRWMYKARRFDPSYGSPNLKEEDGPAYASPTEGWIENGAGWVLGGWIEDAAGALRPQTPAELVQCVGCHSGHVPQPETGGYALFMSGVGVTVDSTWAMARRHQGAAGWREMDVMGYRAPVPPGAIGTAAMGDTVNRALKSGEFAHFLKSVVGVNLFGEMPPSVEAFLSSRIRRDRGYAADWPALPTDDADSYLTIQAQRAALLATLVDKGEHLTDSGVLQGALLYPPQEAAREAARRYGMVVATQSYCLGKEVFARTPASYRYFRTGETGFAHQDGRPYRVGEIITDRPVDTDPVSLTWGIGTTPTLIEDSPDYQPLLD